MVVAAPVDVELRTLTMATSRTTTTTESRRIAVKEGDAVLAVAHAGAASGSSGVTDTRVDERPSDS